MSWTTSHLPDGTYTYGPEGFVPKGWRWVTADDPLAPGDAWWNGHFNPYSLIVQSDQVGQTGFYRGWAITQIDPDKVGYFVAQWSKGNTTSGNMTPDEILQASQMSTDIATSKVLDQNLGGYEAAMAWLASADQQTNSQISSWLTDERNNPPPPSGPADQQQDQSAADSGDQQNLDNADQNAQTGNMDEQYYSDEEWYADQMASQDYSGDYNYGDYAGTDTTDYSSYDSSTQTPDYTDYSSYGYQDLGGGQWYDPSDNSTYDESTGEWTYADASGSVYDTPATDSGTDYAAQGLEDLGDNMWFNPNDGSVYDAATGVTTAGWGEQDSFVDPISGTTFYQDGSFMLPDGTTVTADGNYVFEDGTTLLQNGDYVDANGQTWENMAWGGAPNSWQNTTTGDVWNMNDGTYVTAQYAQQVEGGDRISYDQFLAQQKQDDPANYARLTQPASRPGGSSGGGGGGSGISLGGGGKAAGAAGGVTLADLNKLLQTAATATQAVVAAKNSGAPANQLAALQRTAQQAAQAAAAAKAVGISTGNIASPISTFLKQNSTTLLIAGAAVVALLLIAGRKSTPTPASNVAA